MKVVHLSDLHLGHAASGLGSGRERDVARVFGEAMAQIAELAPALVVVAGDVFDHAHVGAPAIAVFAREVGELAKRVPGVVVAVAAGVRDVPLGGRQPGPLEVVRELDGVEVAVEGVRRFRLEEHDATVTLAPHAAWAEAGGDALVAEPDSRAKWNVLAAYVDLAGEPGDGRQGAALRTEGWDYVALGSRHVRTRIAERVHYSGSLERIGEDPWKEAANDKGFVVADLESGETAFHPVRARVVVSLAPVDAGKGGPVAVARRLSEAVAGVPGGVEGKLVRVPVRGLGPDDFAALDRDALGPLRRRAAGLRVDALPGPWPASPSAPRTLRSPASPRSAAAGASDASAARGASGKPDLRDLQMPSFGGLPAVDLQGATGLVAVVTDAESTWEPVADNAPVAGNAPAANNPRVAGNAPVACNGRAAEDALAAFGGAARQARGLGRSECAAIWLGAGSVETWLSAGAALLRESASAAAVVAERDPAAGEPSAAQDGGAGETLAGWLRRLVRKTEEDVGRLERSQEGTDELKDRLARLREDAAEAQGDLEAATMGWVRERQDAETRLLLHRDRATELKKKLKEIEKAEQEAASGGDDLAKERTAKAAKARRDEWDAVVQDGQWWRRRREQLEDKPPEIKAAEKRALEIEAEMDAVSEEVERRRVQAEELRYARRRLRDLRAAASRVAPRMAWSGGSRASLLATERFRERVHVEAVTITGGRLAAAFPDLFAGWVGGRLRSGGDVAALELATRIALADLTVDAGLDLGSVLLPRALFPLREEDLARAISRLSGLARRVPVVLVGADRAVVAAAPQSFDSLILAAADSREARKPPRQRLRPATARLL